MSPKFNQKELDLMETSSRFFFTIEDFRPTSKKDPTKIFPSFGELVKKFSQESSLYPDLPNRKTGTEDYKLKEIWFRGEIDSAQESLAFLAVLSFIKPQRGYFTLKNVLNHFYEMAKTYNFQGKWEQVGETLSQSNYYQGGINGTLSVIIQEMNENDFYGNFLPLMYSMLKKLRVRQIYPAYQDPENLSKRMRLKGIHRQERKRGYNDKGSRRPPHEVNPLLRGKTVVTSKEEEELRKLKELKYLPKEPRTRDWFGYLQFRKKNGNTSTSPLSLE